MRFGALSDEIEYIVGVLHKNWKNLVYLELKSGDDGWDIFIPILRDFYLICISVVDISSNKLNYIVIK